MGTLVSIHAQVVGQTATGLASYFSAEFHGSKTKYGEIYNRNELVAANNAFPYNAKLRVTNLENNRSVVVRVIDEGPFIQGRIIEVSYRAAEQLGMLGKSTSRVKIELLELPSAYQANSSSVNTSKTNDPSNTATAPTPPQVVAPALPSTPSQPSSSTSSSTGTSVMATPTPSPQARAAAPAVSTASRKQVAVYGPVANKYLQNGSFADGLYKIELRAPGTGTHGVQVMSLTSLEAAMQEVAKLQAKWFENILVKRQGDNYKVILGPFEDTEAAQAYAKDLQRKYNIKGFVLSLK
ncbi:MAG: septal ring lytic transglycosylase RlpA family protein [Lewinella sp.]|nr:septal ring lytic transglycosylase RlpA family protein [Lewinella sp.]